MNNRIDIYSTHFFTLLDNEWMRSKELRNKKNSILMSSEDQSALLDQKIHLYKSDRSPIK